MKFVHPIWKSWLQRFEMFRPALIPGRPPVPFLAELGVLKARPLLFHAIHVSDEDLRLLAANRCAVVHCPRSNHLLSCGRMPLEKFLAVGIQVYLGTDSLSSSPGLDVRDEADFARTLHASCVTEQQLTTILEQSLESWLNAR
jgi:cytosine/adenosine deaminase-related metal-dependent hydrolase